MPDFWKKSTIATIYASAIKSQTHLDPPLGAFSAIDLTFSDPSIFLDYNWRIYKGPCLQWPLPNNNRKYYNRRLRIPNQTPAITSSNPLEIQNKPLIRKSKWIQTTKRRNSTPKDPLGELSPLKYTPIPMPK